MIRDPYDLAHSLAGLLADSDGVPYSDYGEHERSIIGDAVDTLRAVAGDRARLERLRADATREAQRQRDRVYRLERDLDTLKAMIP